jgi:hypothetical protein
MSASLPTSSANAGIRAGALLLVAVTIAAGGCTNAGDSSDSAPTRPIAQQVTRSACQVQLPGDWKQSLEDSRVDTGGYGKPMAVGPGGEIIARRDDDILLIEPDKSVSTVYTFPSSANLYAKVAELDERWIVLGLGEQTPANYQLGTELRRITVIDRRDGSVRTITETSDADYREGRHLLNSVALFDDTVYWITHDGEAAGGEGTLRSHQLNTGAETDVESGSMGALRATATGLAWNAFNPTRTVFRALEPLPAALSTLTGINEDQTSLVRDGDVYAWITGIAAGGTGVARWSPQTGLTRINTVRLFDMDQEPQPQPRVHIAGPYVVLSKEDSTVTTLVDTRSGALALLGYSVIGAANATIGIQIGEFGESSAPTTGSVRTDALPPLSCSSSDSVRPSCEISLPGKWRQALEDDIVRTGGSTEPLAVGPAGEIAASYDDRDSRRLLLIDRNDRVKIVYTVADPAIESVGFAALDERWIVVGVDRGFTTRDHSRGYLRDDGEYEGPSNPRSPILDRIDVIDRKDGSVRTIMARTAADPADRRGYGSVASMVVFDHTVYWTTESDGADTVLRGYDLDTNGVAEVASAERLENLHATPVGIAWTEGNEVPRRVEHRVTDLPTALAAAGAAPEDTSLVSDGTSYVWATEEGIAHWSPDSGVNRVATIDIWRHSIGPVHVVGPYIIAGGSLHGSGESTILDTRSGAVMSVDARIVDTGVGTVVVQVPANDYQAPQINPVRLTDLPPLAC